MLSQQFVLPRSKNFTSNVAIQMPPSVPFNHYRITSSPAVAMCGSSSIVPCFTVQTHDCFEHSNLLRVNTSSRKINTVKCNLSQQRDDAHQGAETDTGNETARHYGINGLDYELFKRSNFCICLQRLVLPRLLAPDLPSIRSSVEALPPLHSDYKPYRLISLFFVTTSSFQHWVICVPAAFLKSGSRFSGSLSGIEP